MIMKNLLRFMSLLALSVLLVACGNRDGYSHGGGAENGDPVVTPLGWTGFINANGGNADDPQVAFGAIGNAIVVWQQDDGTWDSIYANFFNGTGWDGARLIETDSLGDAEEPQIAMDSGNNAIAVWKQYIGSTGNVYANIYNGTNWEGAELLETNTDNVYSHQIAMDSSGNGIAVWNQFVGPTGHVFANIYNGTNWEGAESLETNSGNASSPAIAMDSSGNAIAAWKQHDGTRDRIYGNFYNGTGWEGDRIIETTTAGYARIPQVAMDSSGNATVVWDQYDSPTYNIYANFYNGTGWDGVELLETDTGIALNPQIAMDSSGNAIAVWKQWDGTSDSIYSNFYNGTDWEGAELVGTDNVGAATNPQVARDPDGKSIVVWTQDDGSTTNIWANISN